MLDPLILLIIRVGFGLLFILAGLHKLADRDQFRGILNAYQLLPQRVVPAASFSLPVLELLLGLAWFLVAGASPLIPLLTALLLGAYTLAIGINLHRGRRHIDCGCGFRSSAGKEFSSGDGQQLSNILLLRNCLLIAVALIAASPVVIRQLGLIDAVFVLFASMTFFLLYGAFNQLVVNNNAIGAWRNSRG